MIDHLENNFAVTFFPWGQPDSQVAWRKSQQPISHFPLCHNPTLSSDFVYFISCAQTWLHSMESRVEGIFLVLVDLCMNYWEIRLQSDLWRAALGSGCLGCGWQVCQDSHYCGLEWGLPRWVQSLQCWPSRRMVFFIRNLIFFWRQRPAISLCRQSCLLPPLKSLHWSPGSYDKINAALMLP